jgi:hypothetical protein
MIIHLTNRLGTENQWGGEGRGIITSEVLIDVQITVTCKKLYTPTGKIFIEGSRRIDSSDNIFGSTIHARGR